MAKPKKPKPVYQSSETKDNKNSVLTQDSSDDKVIKQKIESIQFDTFKSVFSSGTGAENQPTLKSDSFTKQKESQSSSRQFFKKEETLAPQKNSSLEKLTPSSHNSSQNLSSSPLTQNSIQGIETLNRTTTNYQNYVAIENAVFSQSNLIDTEKAYFIKEHPEYFGDIYLSELQLFFQFKSLKVVNKCIQSKIVLLNKLLTCYLFQITK